MRVLHEPPAQASSGRRKLFQARNEGPHSLFANARFRRLDEAWPAPTLLSMHSSTWNFI
jgi:hypothetical protein